MKKTSQKSCKVRSVGTFRRPRLCLAYVQQSPDIPVGKADLTWQKHLNVTLLKLSFKLKYILGRGYDCFEDVVAHVMSWLSCLRPLGQNSSCCSGSEGLTRTCQNKVSSKFFLREPIWHEVTGFWFGCYLLTCLGHQL
jgi:hypothetical protein